jgi:hypothetical protein
MTSWGARTGPELMHGPRHLICLLQVSGPPQTRAGDSFSTGPMNPMLAGQIGPSKPLQHHGLMYLVAGPGQRAQHIRPHRSAYSRTRPVDHGARPKTAELTLDGRNCRAAKPTTLAAADP